MKILKKSLKILLIAIIVIAIILFLFVMFWKPLGGKVSSNDEEDYAARTD